MPIDRLYRRGEWLHRQLANGVVRERYEYAFLRIAHRWIIAARRELTSFSMAFLETIDEEDRPTFPGELTDLREAVMRMRNALGVALILGHK